MIGLVLSFLYLAYASLTGDTSTNILVMSCLEFLWNWHMVWSVILLFVMVMIFTFGVSYKIGALCFATPLLAVFALLRQGLLLGGVALMLKAGAGPEGALPFDQWSIPLVVIAILMYIIGMLTSSGWKVKS